MPANSELQFPKTAISDGEFILGTDENPVRVDPTGTTVQPVNVVSGGGGTSVGPTGDPVPVDATFVGGNYNGDGSLRGLQVTSEGWLRVVTLGSDGFSTAQVTVTNTATAIAFGNTGAQGVLITNLGTTDVWIGGPSVTTSTGTLLPGVRGAALSIPCIDTVYGIVASGSQAVSVLVITP